MARKPIQPDIVKLTKSRTKVAEARTLISAVQNPTKRSQDLVDHLQRERANAYNKTVNLSGRDIAPLPVERLVDGGKVLQEGINWDRRLSCKGDLERFGKTYMPNVFYFDTSKDQKKAVKKIETVFLYNDMFALAMPRGGGKTAWCRAGLLWGTAYGYKTFAYFVGSTDPKAVQTLSFIKMYWYSNPLLRQDFPEIAYPVYKLENRHHLANGQLFYGRPSYIHWGSDTLRYPCLLLPEHVAQTYYDYDPSSLAYFKEEGQNTKRVWHEPYPDNEVIRELPPKNKLPLGLYTTAACGTMFATAGIDGSIRGEAEVHPIFLEQPRPDVVLLDDVQKDQKADSPAQCDKLLRLIEGAVTGLSRPGEHISALFPCTVIREGDVADTILDPTKKPEWRGERCAMVLSWPPGITDFEITNDTPSAELWNKYAELRKESLRVYEDLRLCKALYEANREVMDLNFECSWLERYTKAGKDVKEGNVELSANQHAMNLRLALGPMFAPEYQNRGRKLSTEGEIMITAGALTERTSGLERGECGADYEIVTAFIDVQNEMLFWGIVGMNNDYTGSVLDYGHWPPVNSAYFTKSQTESWSMMTRSFFKVYPEYADKAVVNNRGKARAPLEAKIYYALSRLVPQLLAREFVRQDQHKKVMKIDKLAIDTRWGQASEAIKRYIRESGIRELVPYYGQSLPPTHRQFEEYERRTGWLFEDQRHPDVREAKWCIKPNADGMFYMASDVDRMKDFLFARLSTPAGAAGSLTLFNAPAEQHQMFADQICNSEYPEPLIARGKLKNQWKEREGQNQDNEGLDILCGCLALASLQGASLKTRDGEVVTIRRKLSEVRDRKRAV